MTTLTPYDRYARELRDWQRNTVESLLDSPLSPLGSDAVTFKMNIEDAGDKYLITALLPGVSRDEIDVELNEGRLSITVNRTESDEEKNRNYLYKETHDWSATRGVYLKDASVTGLAAKLADGVLTVTVPKQVEKVNVTKVTID